MAADFFLSYGGIPFVVDNPDVQAFMGQYVPPTETRVTVPERSWPGANLTGLTFPMRGIDRPRMRFGQFFWPVGASRWAEYHGLITDDQYPGFTEVAYRNGGGNFANVFVMQQPTHAISSSMYLLPPRPVAKYGNHPGLYHVTLVDERYYFQWRSAGQFRPANWKSALSLLATALNITLTTDKIPAVYGVPNPNSDLWSNYENAAVLLDAVAANVGMAITRSYDGTYQAQNRATSRKTVLDNRQDNLVAGGALLS